MQAGDCIDEMFKGAAEAIQLPDDKGVALPCVGQSFGQADPVIFSTASGVMKKHAHSQQNSAPQRSSDTLISRRLLQQVLEPAANGRRAGRRQVKKGSFFGDLHIVTLFGTPLPTRPVIGIA